MRQVGYTLVEIAVVVLILGVVAAALLQTNASVDADQALEAAASEVAAAFRFARSEAIRTGQLHGVDASSATQRVRVYRLNGGAIEYSVRHPIDKKLYDLDFTANPLLEPVNIDSAVFWFEGVFFPVGLMGFEATGTPKFDFFGTRRMLSSGAVALSAAGRVRTVQVAPMTGRVTIQ